MAEAFAPFPIQRTMCNLTFYMMEGRNFVRKKSSLTRRKVLYAPCFKNTRHNAGLMGRASKIGSFLYNSLPVYWRQSWMYRSFTGEAYTMLKKGKEERDIKQFLWDRYIQEVIEKRTNAKPVSLPELTPTKRAYKKQDTTYWETKTRKSIQRKARKQQRQRNSGLLAEASTIASDLYRDIPARNRSRSIYQQLTGWAMRLLKDLQDDEDTSVVQSPPVQQYDGVNHITRKQISTNEPGYINCQKGIFYFIAPSHKRLFIQSKNPVHKLWKYLSLLHLHSQGKT